MRKVATTWRRTRHETSSLSQSSLVDRLLMPLIFLKLVSLNLYMRAGGVKSLSLQEHLMRLNVYNSMGPDGMHPRVPTN